MRDYSRLARTPFARGRATRTVLVVGAGALGNEVIKNLALMGVDSLWIADRDRIEASNLTRSVLFCTPDIQDHIARGTPKAVFAASRVREINPDVSVTPYVGEVADLGHGILRRADLVFSCVDNEMARLELSWACSRFGRLLIDGGLGLINYSSGQVTVFPRQNGPCYACRKGAARRRQLLQDLQGREDPCWRKEMGADEADDPVVTTPTMASVIAAFQVELGLRMLEQSADAVGLGRSYRVTFHPTPSLEPSVFERSPACPLHEESSIVRTVEEYREARSDSWTAADLLRLSRKPAYLTFDWPLTSQARCRACSHDWEPLVRRARFRGQACPRCGSRDVVETEVLTGIGRDSAWASRTLADLGLPRGHVHELVEGPDPDAPRVHVEITGDLPSLELAPAC